MFYLSLWNTIRIWVGNAIPQFGMALILTAIFTFYRVRGKNFYRAVFYLPNLITATSVGLLFNLLLDGDNSPINQLLVALGVHGAPISFFMSKTLTSGLVSFVQWWMWFGYTTVIILAGTTTVDKSLYEAGDGGRREQIPNLLEDHNPADPSRRSSTSRLRRSSAACSYSTFR